MTSPSAKSRRSDVQERRAVWALARVRRRERDHREEHESDRSMPAHHLPVSSVSRRTTPGASATPFESSLRIDPDENCFAFGRGAHSPSRHADLEIAIPPDELDRVSGANELSRCDGRRTKHLSDPDQPLRHPPEDRLRFIACRVDVGDREHRPPGMSRAARSGVSVGRARMSARAARSTAAATGHTTDDGKQNQSRRT